MYKKGLKIINKKGKEKNDKMTKKNDKVLNKGM